MSFKKVVFKVKATLKHECLGTASANPEIHEIHIASKSKDKDKIKEELESLSVGELMEKAMTIFPKDDKGNPFLWDYQIKGTIKAALGAMVEVKPLIVGKEKIKISKWTYKKFVDNFVFIDPRKVSLNMPEGASMGTCTRPLRADTMRGERIALATSESVPEGSTLEFWVEVLEPSLVATIKECLDYGKYKGYGQWRNSGRGAYTWEEVAVGR